MIDSAVLIGRQYNHAVASDDAVHFVAGDDTVGQPLKAVAHKAVRAGTKVNVRRRTGGYWLVRSADGVEGYVLGEAVHEPGTEPLP